MLLLKLVHKITVEGVNCEHFLANRVYNRGWTEFVPSDSEAKCREIDSGGPDYWGEPSARIEGFLGP